jgi:hypothetical protein
MSKKGLEQVAKVFSLMQETRQDLIKMGMEKDPVDRQDLVLATMLEEMKDFSKDTFSKITTQF